MAGNKIGGTKAALTNKQRYGDNFYSVIGKIGGQHGTTGGFAANRELARIAGRKGGLISRRTGVRNKDSQTQRDINALQESE